MNQEKYIKSLGHKELSIEHPIFKKFAKAFSYAIEKTKEELDQAVEGMYHNLNTLNWGA